MRTWSSGQQLRVGLSGLLTVTLALPVHAIEPSPPGSTSEPVAVADQAEALRLFREARALYTAGQPREAALAFERSFAAAASPEAAYNAAQAHDKADDPISTLRWFRRYLEIAHQDADPSYPLALTRATELRARVGELRVELERPDEVAEIRVDGQPVPSTSFPHLVLPGRVELQFIGRTPDQVVDITSEAAPGETATIYFPGFARPVAKVPDPRQPVVPEPITPPGPNNRLRALKIAFWTTSGLTVASAAVMGAFGGLTLHNYGTYSQLQADCENPDCGMTLDERNAVRESAVRQRDNTNVMVGVTVGLAVVSLALGITALRESRRSRGASTRAGQFMPVPGGFRVAF